MINNLEYFSAKTYHDSTNPDNPIQGTGTILASQGKYYLVTALHCMRMLDEDNKEIVSPDWRKMKATVYLADDEVNLDIKKIVDVDNDNDWAILEIERPQTQFDYQHSIVLSTIYKMDEVFGAYGFPHHVDDGMYLEFTPANQRGRNWQLKEMVNGGSTKAITAEKGCSGMGLFHVVDDRYCCLGIINKSVPRGDFNMMRLVSVKQLAKYFPDIYQQRLSAPLAPSDEELEAKINETTQKQYAEANDQVLVQQFLSYMELAQYADAYQVIKQIWERHPQDEWTTLNYIKATSLAEPQELEGLQEIALRLEYSTSQGVVFVSRAFANNGYPQTAVDIWYNNALKFNDNELDTLFYVELLDSPMKVIVYKEYEMVTEGKCVLYDDGNEHRHCLIASDKTLMARTMLEKKKNEEFVLNIGGEDRIVKIIAIYDKYYSLVHRALTDVMEQGGNRIMRPIKVNAQMTPDEVLKTIFEAAGMDTSVNVDVELQEDYNAQPSFLLNCNSDDLLWSYYRFLFTDFKLCTWPAELKDPERFRYLRPETRFVIDLSSLIVLFEKTMKGEYKPTRRFIVSNYLYELIKDYKTRAGWQISYDRHKVIEAGIIHKFSDDALEDVKLRYDTLLKWMDDYCERASSHKILEIAKFPNETEATQLFKHTITLVMDDFSRALLTEDWYYMVLIKDKLFMFECNEFLKCFNSEEFLGLKNA